MKISIKILQQVVPDAVFHGFNGNEVFELLNIAHLKQFDSLGEVETLYFIVYEDNPEVEGWYNQPFDRSKNIDSLLEKPNIHFVVDDRVDKSVFNKDTKYIYVKNIFNTIKLITDYVVGLVKPIVVGITGSVGKTTAAALVEDVIQRSNSCKRIYSKRLTPLTLSSWLVNFLDKDVKTLVLEYSMYRSHHIKILAQVLPPTYGVFLNIKRMHLGVQGINSVGDIVESKAELLKAAAVSVINFDEELIRPLINRKSLVFSFNSPDVEELIHAKAVSKGIDLEIHLYNRTTIKLSPYVNTKLFAYQSLIAVLLGLEFKVPIKEIEDAINAFQPEENRIRWVQLAGLQYLLDGDVTISGRLQALAENSYKKPLLIIISFDFGEENVQLQINDFNKVFDSFSEVRILDTPSNQFIIDKFGFKGLLISNKKDLFIEAQFFDFRVVHYGTYFRRFSDLTELESLI